MNDLFLSPIRLNDLESLIEKSVKKVLSSEREQPKDRLFSIEEAATFLKLAVPTLYGFTSRRFIPFMKKGKRLYFKESDLIKWLESGKRKSQDEILIAEPQIATPNVSKQRGRQI